MIADKAELLGRTFKAPQMNNVIQGIRQRAGRILQNLMRMDISQNPELQNGANVLSKIVNGQTGSVNVFSNRSKLYGLFDQLEYGLNQLNDYSISKAYSGGGTNRGGASTVSGDLLKPGKAMKTGVRQKNSKELMKPTTSISEYLPYLVIGGVVLLVMFSGQKAMRRS